MKMKTVVKKMRLPSGKSVLNVNQIKGAAVKACNETWWTLTTA